MRKWIVAGALIVILSSVLYTFLGSDDPETYQKEINELREETNRFMQYSEESPFHDQPEEYKGLSFFPPDLKYKVVARFEPVDEAEIYDLPTNDGKKQEYLTYGYATFTINDTTEQVLLLENVREEKIFLPFGDATSAASTYGAGRYLDVQHHGGRTIVLDFNKAYNPYCAYIASFSCPLPPRENLLSVAIPAGELDYH